MFIFVLGSGIMESGGDIQVPARTTDLTVIDVSGTSITLQWTAPGDNGEVGQASEYDLRYSTTGEITEENFDDASVVLDVPAPQIAGSIETFEVTSLDNDTQYWFALRTADEVPNWSLVSNSSTGTTLDIIAPDAVADLTASNPSESTVDLTWTSTGDDGNVGTADHYLIRRSTSTITEGNWAAATPVSGSIPAPLEAGTEQSMTVIGLTANTQYFFAMKVVDEEGNESALSNVDDVTTLFVPTVISNCAMWMRADLGVTMDGLNRVAAWADQSGNGKTAIQTTDSKKPIWTSSVAAVNNQPALSYNAASLQELVSDLAQPADGAAFSVAIVFQEQGSTANKRVLGSTNIDDFFFISQNPGAAENVGAGWANISNIMTVNTTENAANYAIARMIAGPTGGANLLTKDGTSSTASTFNGGQGDWTIGSHSVGFSRFWTGYIAEVIVYHKTISDTERASLISYLQSRYGL